MTSRRIEDYRTLLADAGQSHVLAHWPALNETGRAALLAQLDRVDLSQLASLHARRDKPAAALDPESIKPVSCSTPSPTARARGEAALRNGEVAALIVAGGQGTRLGFDHPKGFYAVTPLAHKPLFRVHAEKVLALSRRYGKPMPLLVMTSDATHDETVAGFEKARYYGLEASQVRFFRQASMPALDLATGRLLLDAPGKLFLAPDGHGGTLTALATSGLLRELTTQGIRTVFYFQVDNPLVAVGDPAFLGHHLEANAEVSSKVVAKRNAKEKMGVFALVNGRCAIVEYSDLPDELAAATDAHGKLRLWAGNPAIHLFDVGFLDRMTRSPEYLDFHVARKKVPFLSDEGVRVEPSAENALKFERFIFDVLPAADRWTLVETAREEEFAPLKNADGLDSPLTVEQLMCDQAARWVTRAGGNVADGVRLEVSPLFALDADELASKIAPGTTFDRNAVLEPEAKCSTR